MGEIDIKEVARLKRIKEEQERRRAERLAARRAAAAGPSPLSKGLSAVDRVVRLFGLGAGTAVGGALGEFIDPMNRTAVGRWLPDLEDLPEAARAFNRARQRGDWDAAIEAYQEELGGGPGFWGAAEIGGSFIPTGGPALLGARLLSSAPRLAGALSRVAPQAARPGVRLGLEQTIRGTGKAMRAPWELEEAASRLALRGIKAAAMPAVRPLVRRFRRPGAEAVEELAEAPPPGLSPEELAVSDEILGPPPTPPAAAAAEVAPISARAEEVIRKELDNAYRRVDRAEVNIRRTTEPGGTPSPDHGVGGVRQWQTYRRAQADVVRLHEELAELEAKQAIPTAPPTPAVAAAAPDVHPFTEMAKAQRGRAEALGTRVFPRIGIGLHQSIAEAAGDIINRIGSGFGPGGGKSWSLDATREKVGRVYDSLTHEYGFAKEVDEQLREGIRNTDISYEDAKETMRQWGLEYASEYRKLPTYNQAHRDAQEVAIAFGEGRYDDAIAVLRRMKLKLSGTLEPRKLEISDEDAFRYMYEGAADVPTPPTPAVAAAGAREWAGVRSELEELRKIDAEGNFDLMGRPVARPSLVGLRESELIASARAKATEAADAAYNAAKPPQGETTGWWAGQPISEITDEDAIVKAGEASQAVLRQFQEETGIDVRHLIRVTAKEAEEIFDRPTAIPVTPAARGIGIGPPSIVPAAREVAQAPTPVTPTGPRVPQLPGDLAGAKPNYNPGARKYTPQFESDLDKALFIVAQTKKSRRDADYMGWLAGEFPDISETQLRVVGRAVREHIKKTVRGKPDGDVVIPKSNAVKELEQLSVGPDVGPAPVAPTGPPAAPPGERPPIGRGRVVGGKPPDTPVDTPQMTAGGPEPTVISASITRGFGAAPELTMWSKGVNIFADSIAYLTGRRVVPERLSESISRRKRVLSPTGKLETPEDIHGAVRAAMKAKADVERQMVGHGSTLAAYIRQGKKVFGEFDKQGRIMDPKFRDRAQNVIDDEVYRLERPTIQDVAARMGTYRDVMNEEQRKFMESLRDIFENGTSWTRDGLTREMPGWNAMLREWLGWDPRRVRPDIDEHGFYLSRGPAKPPGARSQTGYNDLLSSFTAKSQKKLNKRMIAQNRAQSPSMSSAIDSGVTYDTFEDAMVGHINDVASKLSDINLGRTIKDVNRRLPKAGRKRTLQAKEIAKELKVGRIPGLDIAYVDDELADAIRNQLKQPGFRVSEMRVLNQINRIYRGFKATYDFSAIGIHGAFAAFRDPVMWSKAAKVSLNAFFDRDNLGVADAMLHGADEVAKARGLLTSDFWSTAGLRIAGPGTEYGIPFMARLAQGRIPVVKQAAALFERSNLSFGVFGDTLRLDWANKLLEEELRRGRTLKELWDTGQMREMASIANKLTGWSEGRFGGDIGDVLMFAPKYFQSRIESYGQAMSGAARLAGRPFGTRQTIQSREALRSIMQMWGYGISLTEIINAATGHETDRRPWVDGAPNPNFYAIRYGGQDFSLFGPSIGFFQAIANTVTGHPERAMRSLGSGVLRLAWDNLTGFAFTGKEALITVDERGDRRFTDAGRAMEYIASLVTPIAPGQAGEQLLGVAQQIPAAMRQLAGVEPEEELVGPSPVERVIGGTLAVGAETVGGRVSPLSRRDWENEIAQEQFGMAYDDLNNNVKPLVDKLVEEKYGEPAYLGKKGPLYKRVDAINADFLATLQDAADEHLSDSPGAIDFSPHEGKKVMRRAQKNRQAALHGTEWDKARQRHVGGVYERIYDRDEEREEPEQGTREHLLWRYYNLIPEATDEKGLINWDDEESATPSYDSLSREFWASMEEGQVEELLANIRVIEGEYPEAMKTVVDAGRYAGAYRGTVDGESVSYWDIEDLPAVRDAILVTAKAASPDVTPEHVTEYMDADPGRRNELKQHAVYNEVDKAIKIGQREGGVIHQRRYAFVAGAPLEWMLAMYVADYHFLLKSKAQKVLMEKGLFDGLMRHPYEKLYKDALRAM